MGLAKRKNDWDPIYWHGRGPFYRMKTAIPEGQVGTATIEHFTVGEGDNMRAAFGHPDEYVTPGDYCRLMINGSVIMSDTNHERRTNIGAVIDATGDVVLGGLGIGLIVLPILARPAVTSVLVIEKNLDVIALVGPHLEGWIARSAQTGERFASKLRIVQGDAKTWEPDRPGRQFDYIYLDIWGDQSTDVIPEMQQLHRRFRKWLRKGGKVTSWNYDGLRDQQRQERRAGW